VTTALTLSVLQAVAHMSGRSGTLTAFATLLGSVRPCRGTRASTSCRFSSKKLCFMEHEGLWWLNAEWDK